MREEKKKQQLKMIGARKSTHSPLNVSTIIIATKKIKLVTILYMLRRTVVVLPLVMSSNFSFSTSGYENNKYSAISVCANVQKICASFDIMRFIENIQRKP